MSATGNWLMTGKPLQKDLAGHVVGVEVEGADVLADLLDGCIVFQEGRAHIEDLLCHARRLARDL